MKSVIVIGGGLSGLISSILLARKGIEVSLIEKKEYPFHRVCGEYISNEVVPFLKANGLFPINFYPPNITRFQLSSVSGKNKILPLDMGGFGISRYSFDHFLYQEAIKSGVKVLQNTEATEIKFNGNIFEVIAGHSSINCDVVLCSYGKRTKLDVDSKRSFTLKRSPYVGIKYHIQTEHPSDLIALHNFEGGYCGMSNIEGGKTNLCYLVSRDALRKQGNIAALEENVLKRNPILKSIFNNSKFLVEKPETINEISFATKEPLFNHMLMLGDAAGMITPLCGNGMAMAIRSGKMAAELTEQFIKGNASRAALESQYKKQWTTVFANHLWFGRQVQKLFGNEWASNAAIQLAIKTEWIAKSIIRNTHGKAF